MTNTYDKWGDLIGKFKECLFTQLYADWTEERELSRIERDGLGSQLLDVQQDCIKVRTRYREFRGILQDWLKDLDATPQGEMIPHEVCWCLPSGPGLPAIVCEPCRARIAVEEAEEECDRDEKCERCGRRYSIAWSAPDEIWKLVTGHGEEGLLCPYCFDEMARGKGIILAWSVNSELKEDLNHIVVTQLAEQAQEITQLRDNAASYKALASLLRQEREALSDRAEQAEADRDRWKARAEKAELCGTCDDYHREPGACKLCARHSVRAALEGAKDEREKIT